MKPVTFVRYHQPNGRKSTDSIDRPDEIADKALAIQGAGYQLDIEILPVGQISMTVTHPRTEECLAHEICDNGPDVPLAVDRMILRAAEQLPAA